MASSAGELPVRLLTLNEVMRMTQAEILQEGERLELVGGRLMTMPEEAPAHGDLIAIVRRLLLQRYGPPYLVYRQPTFPLGAHDFLAPDLVAHDVPLFERGPRPEEVTLIVEVAGVSLPYDLGAKAHVYAAWGAPDYWVLDIAGRRLVTHCEPGPSGYRRVATFAPGDEVTLPRQSFPVDVADLLPPKAP